MNELGIQEGPDACLTGEGDGGEGDRGASEGGASEGGEGGDVVLFGRVCAR